MDIPGTAQTFLVLTPIITGNLHHKEKSPQLRGWTTCFLPSSSCVHLPLAWEILSRWMAQAAISTTRRWYKEELPKPLRTGGISQQYQL